MQAMQLAVIPWVLCTCGAVRAGCKGPPRLEIRHDASPQRSKAEHGLAVFSLVRTHSSFGVGPLSDTWLMSSFFGRL